MTDEARAALVERRAEQMFRDWVYGAMPVNPFPEWKDMPPFPKEGWLYAASQELAREQAAMERTRDACVAEMVMAAHVVARQKVPKNHEEFVFQRAAKILRKMILPDATGER